MTSFIGYLPVLCQLPVFQSLVLFGPGNIQLYLREGWEGFSYCLEIGSNGKTEVSDVMRELGLQPDAIKSFRFGCNGSDSVTIRLATEGSLNGDVMDAGVREPSRFVFV